MRIDIWSDVVCPWCYIGKRRLEKALAEFAHADDVEIHWRSFLLDPSAPTTPVETAAESLGRKYGGGVDAGRQMLDRVGAVAAEEGMTWRHHESQRVSTVDAHRLLHLAYEEGGATLQGHVKEALLHAYFVDARNIADHSELLDITGAVGLDSSAADRVLSGSEFSDEVQADIEQATAYGATGVPFFVVDERFGVSGAQPVEALTQVLEQAWAQSHPEPHPAVQIVASGEECGPDGCAV